MQDMSADRSLQQLTGSKALCQDTYNGAVGASNMLGRVSQSAHRILSQKLHPLEHKLSKLDSFMHACWQRLHMLPHAMALAGSAPHPELYRCLNRRAAHVPRGPGRSACSSAHAWPTAAALSVLQRDSSLSQYCTLRAAPLLPEACSCTATSWSTRGSMSSSQSSLKSERPVPGTCWLACHQAGRKYRWAERAGKQSQAPQG